MWAESAMFPLVAPDLWPLCYQTGSIWVMAMTLRPDDQLAEDLRAQAEVEGRSQSAVALDAVREYVDRRARTARLDQIAHSVAARHRGLLKRLGE